jgi:hypothetical protein
VFVFDVQRGQRRCTICLLSRCPTLRNRGYEFIAGGGLPHRHALDDLVTFS